MFGNSRKKGPLQAKYKFFFGLMAIALLIAMGLGERSEGVTGNLIRFHVIANSDQEEDQLLKYAVRDAILKKAAPKLAESASIEESRTILLGLEGELLDIASEVICEWGKDYPVSLDYGIDTFPTKSYGNIVLPAGEYEAVKIKIGEAQGANWWCVLFPPLCFVNVEESTALPVDGKAAVPIDSVKKDQSAEKPADQVSDSDQEESKEKAMTTLTTYKGKKVGFFFERFLH